VLRFRTAILHLSDLRHDRTLVYRSVGIEPVWQQRQVEHLPEIHAEMSRALNSWTSFDEPHVMSRHVPRAYLESSPYVQNCLKPAGIVDIMQYFLIHTPTRLAGLGMGRHQRQGIVTEREIKLGGILLPHFRRAITISDVLDARAIERSHMAEALNALRCAVVLTDARSTILHANTAAEAMFRDGGPIHGTGGILQANVASAGSELRSAISLAAQDEANIGTTGLAIRLSDKDMPPIFAHVLPLTGSDHRTRLESTAVAAVFIGTAPHERDGAELTAAAFGLTPAETRVLASLLAGRTLADTATALSIATTTAKTHLENIFSKTGVARQADLMRLATALVSPTRSAPSG